MRPKKKKKKKRSSPNFGWKFGKLSYVWKVHQENLESSFGKLGKFIWKIRKIRKVH